MSVKTSFSNLCVVLKEKLGNKVDKVEGKGLSANDFTTAYKTKLDGIAAEANKITVDSALSDTSTNPVQNKVVAEKIGTIETNVSAATTTAENAVASVAAVKKDLANYYKKTETYSQAEINNKISAIPKFSITVCKALPDSNISKTTVYLLKSSKEEIDNLYDEYIYVNSKWEKLGTQTVGDIAGLITRMTAAEANIEQNTSSISTINTNLTKKQDKLTAGTNITISGTMISAKDTTYSVATTSTNGLMSKDDKKKLDGMAAIVVDDSISTTSTNAIQNKAVGLKFQGVDSEISGINSVLKNKPNSADVYTKTEVDNKYFMSGDVGIELSEGTDLNSIITPGNYYAKRCLNIPYKELAYFRLEVSYLWNNNSYYYLVQKLYTTDKNDFDIFIRMRGHLKEWSPWHLITRNDYTTCSFPYNDINDKYMKIASNNVNPISNHGNTMVFDVYPNYKKQSGNVNSNEIGKLLCSGYGSSSDYNISAIWISKGLDIYPEDWFITYRQDGADYFLELWKKARNAYESYNVVLSCSSGGPLIAGADLNAVTMYYLKNTYDAYDASLYKKVVTSTTCDSTAATKADIADIQEKVIDTGWITTGNLKYRKSGYIVALQGTVTPSDSIMSITLGALPENCRPSQDINIAQAGTDTPSRQIIVQKGGSVVLLFASNCTASHTYAYNGIFMI